MNDLIEGLKITELQKYKDNRGYFQEVMVYREVTRFSIDNVDFVQENESMSKKGVIRGLHFQFPHQQAKLVRVVKGKIIDVCVDLRSWNKTFLKYSKIELSDENSLCLFIPHYFAHGFLALEDTILSYKCTHYYEPNEQYGIIWNDPKLNIDWGIDNPILSEKDSNLPNLQEALKNLYTKEV